MAVISGKDSWTMLKLQTPTDISRSRISVSYKDRTMLLGSCFADNIGTIMKNMGFNVLVNPFGTLYNPVSVCNSIRRLDSAIPFTEDECVQMGAGSSLICSFSHHTAAARDTAEEFLSDANAALAEASAFFREASTVIITLGTAWTFKFNATGEVVSNCLKRDAREFTRERLPLKTCSILLNSLAERYPDKRFIFTVSPIRHLKDGAHGNQLSKSTLLLAEETVVQSHPGQCEYFPAYEIMMDELRDYRFYAEDMIHPSAQAVNYIWERFCDFALPEDEKPLLEKNRKTFLQSQHRKNAGSSR